MGRVLFWGTFLVWIGMTGWLVERDLLAPRRMASEPRLYRDRFADRTFPLEARYDLLLGGGSVGGAEVRADRDASGTVRWRTQIDVDLARLVEHVGAGGIVAQAAGAGSARVRIDVVVSGGQVLREARVTVWAGAVHERIRIVARGNVLVMRGGDLFRSLTGADEVEIPFDPRAVLDLGLLPLDAGGRLAVGQTWTCHTLDPMRLQVAPIQVTVEERRIHELWAGGIAPEAFVLRWGEAGPGASRTVVDERGRVLRHSQPPLELELLHTAEGPGVAPPPSGADDR